MKGVLLIRMVSQDSTGLEVQDGPAECHAALLDKISFQDLRTLSPAV